MISENLKKYAEVLLKKEDKSCVEKVCQTLWVPIDNTNRSATYNLNHTIVDFFGDLLVGRNANCGTPYIVVEVLGEIVGLQQLAEEVTNKVFVPDNLPLSQILKTAYLNEIVQALGHPPLDEKQRVILSKVEEHAKMYWMPNYDFTS